VIDREMSIDIDIDIFLYIYISSDAPQLPPAQADVLGVDTIDIDMDR